MAKRWVNKLCHTSRLKSLKFGMFFFSPFSFFLCMWMIHMMPWASLLNVETQANICVNRQQQQLPPPRSLLMVYFRHSSEDTHRQAGAHTHTHTFTHHQRRGPSPGERTTSSEISAAAMKGKAVRGVGVDGGGEREGGRASQHAAPLGR